MVNLVGAQGYHGIPKFEGIENLSPEDGYYLHIYDKKETKPYRKMGHVTVLDKSIDKAREKAKWIKEKIKVIA
jgi:5-(carboxyamino)imidazole ribonucleotide synthase